MSDDLHLDMESKSTVDLRKTGVYVYAEDPTTDIWCVAYAFGEDEVQLWEPGGSPPADIMRHVASGGIIFAHNANFERIMWKHILTPRYHWPEPKTEQFRCTMAAAYAMALPGSLENAAAAVGIKDVKDAKGHRLMLQMCKPRRTNTDGVIWWDDAERKNRLFGYCKQDVIVERALEKKLMPLPPKELALWHLDQKINDRGVYVDEKLCIAARGIVKTVTSTLNAELRHITENDVSAGTNVNQITLLLKDNGIEVDSIAKDVLEDLLGRKDLSPLVRRVLEIRQITSRASVAKINALLTGRATDGRANGLLQYHAASTGRWGGRRFQPQNIKRPHTRDVDSLINLLFLEDAKLLEAIYGDPLSAIGDALRGMIRAPKGKKLISADYSNIEGRVLAWLASEDWKMQAFLDYDNGVGEDLYKLTASSILGKPASEITKLERQSHGKVPELAMGFQGGIGAFNAMGVNYGVFLPDEQIEHIRDNWRRKNSMIQKFWWNMEAAAIRAVKAPGKIFTVGKIKFRTAGSFLFMRLPSKRNLCYAYPKMQPKETPWGEMKNAVSYMGVNSYTRKWERLFTYGGKLVENATQAVARDILAEALPKLEAAGYPTILTVHDEAVCEVKEDFGSVSEMERIMCEIPPWAAGCPVSAEGWEGMRYRK